MVNRSSAMLVLLSILTFSILAGCTYSSPTPLIYRNGSDEPVSFMVYLTHLDTGENETFEATVDARSEDRRSLSHLDEAEYRIKAESSTGQVDWANLTLAGSDHTLEVTLRDGRFWIGSTIV